MFFSKYNSKKFRRNPKSANTVKIKRKSIIIYEYTNVNEWFNISHHNAHNKNTIQKYK